MVKKAHIARFGASLASVCTSATTQGIVGICGLLFGCATWWMSEQSAADYERRLAGLEADLTAVRAELVLAREDLGSSRKTIEELQARYLSASLRQLSGLEPRLRHLAPGEVTDLFRDFSRSQSGEDGAWLTRVEQAVALPDGRFLVLIADGEYPPPAMGATLTLALLDGGELTRVETFGATQDATFDVDAVANRISLAIRSNSRPADPDVRSVQWWTCRYAIDGETFRARFSDLDLEGSELADAPCEGTGGQVTTVNGRQ
ncbi:hypothetical protein [Amorphus sp. MBR-141]